MIDDSPVYEIIMLVVIIVIAAVAFGVGKYVQAETMKAAIDCSMCACQAVPV